jgi:hypothetical protein
MGDMATAVAAEAATIQEDVAATINEDVAAATTQVATNVIVVVRYLLITAIADNRRMVVVESVPALYLLQEGDPDYMMRIMRSRPTTSRSKRRSKGMNKRSSAVSNIGPPFTLPES